MKSREMKIHTKIFLLTTKNSVKPSYLSINKKKYEHIKNSNGNKYLTVVTANENKDTLKNMKNYGRKIRDLIRSKSNNQMIMIKNI